MLVGCLLAVIIRNKSFAGFWQTVTAHSLFPLITIGLLLVSIFVGGSFVLRYRDVFGFAVEPLLIAVLIVQLIVLHTAVMWRWLEYKVLQFLGTISYSLYLYQQITLQPIQNALVNHPLIIQLAAALAVTVAVAAASYYWIEKPFLRLKDKPLFWGRNTSNVSTVKNVG